MKIRTHKAPILGFRWAREEGISIGETKVLELIAQGYTVEQIKAELIKGTTQA